MTSGRKIHSLLYGLLISNAIGDITVMVTVAVVWPPAPDAVMV